MKKSKTQIVQEISDINSEMISGLPEVEKESEPEPHIMTMESYLTSMVGWKADYYASGMRAYLKGDIHERTIQEWDQIFNKLYNTGV